MVFSGLPGSGKSWLASKIAPSVGLHVIDKDDILESLFDSRGIGDAAWRRVLSRESDRIFQREAESSRGALLVSFWRLTGMPPGSGTPTAWLRDLSNRLVHVHCVCPPEVAARRYSQRTRHPGHLDNGKSYTEVLQGLQTLARLPAPTLGLGIDVDKSCEVDVDLVACAIAERLDKGGVDG